MYSIKLSLFCVYTFSTIFHFPTNHKTIDLQFENFSHVESDDRISGDSRDSPEQKNTFENNHSLKNWFCLLLGIFILIFFFCIFGHQSKI